MKTCKHSATRSPRSTGGTAIGFTTTDWLKKVIAAAGDKSTDSLSSDMAKARLDNMHR